MTPSSQVQTGSSQTVDSLRPLDQDHDRAAFCCGDERLDKYIKEHASSDMKRDLGLVWVWSRNQQVMGYYTLSPSEIIPGDPIPDALKKLRGRPVGVTLLGRFAVHSSLQGQGYGKMLLMQAFQGVVRAADILKGVGVILDARTDKAKAFWTSRRFVPLGPPNENGSQRFFLSIEYIRELCSTPK